ncbi:MAG: LPP20 family lipoprotein [Spirochaetia bacterium]|jgi:hypothetical protein|nr:LPP20 family lipoprotein [Spirochaetia bacterium]
MIKNVIAAVVCLMVFSCAGTPASGPAPEWAAGAGGIEAAYPAQTYIAQRGRGEDRAAAENDALGQISRFFATEIESQNTRIQHSREQNDVETSTTERVSEIYVRSQTELFSVRYSEPWYNAAEKLWHAVAYIARDEAWVIYEPRARREADKFLQMYRAAQQAKETVRQYGIYGAALNLFDKDVAPVVFFAETLHPAKAASSLRDVEEALTAIPAAMDEARSRSYIYIKCDRDYEDRILAAAEKCFSVLGFPVQKSPARAAAVCAVRVTENETSSGASGPQLFSFRPSASISLTGKEGVLFSWNSQPMDRVTTATRDAGRRRAYTALAAEMEKSFPDFFHRKMGE